VCGWLRTRGPTIGSFPPAAQQTLSDLGLGGFIASIGLGNGPAALAAGGNAEYHLMPPFGNEEHFFIDSPEAIPRWSPLVSKFLDEHR
jgi:hypothetical protein